MENKKFNSPIILGICLLIVGSILKIEHLSFSLEFSFVGVTLIAVFYFLRFLSKKDKQLIDFTGLMFVITWCGLVISKLFRMPYLKELTYILFAIGSIYLIQYIARVLQSGKHNKNATSISSKVLFLVAIISIVLGLFLKIKHLPGSTAITLGGITVALFWFITQLRLKKEN